MISYDFAMICYDLLCFPLFFACFAFRKTREHPSSQPGALTQVRGGGEVRGRVGQIAGMEAGRTVRALSVTRTQPPATSNPDPIQVP